MLLLGACTKRLFALRRVNPVQANLHRLLWRYENRHSVTVADSNDPPYDDFAATGRNEKDETNRAED